MLLQNTAPIALPHGVKPPVHQYFQRVRPKEGKRGIAGIVTGMEYVHPAIALAENSRRWGWLYTISPLPAMEIPLERMVELLGSMVGGPERQIMPEADLMADDSEVAL